MNESDDLRNYMITLQEIIIRIESLLQSHNISCLLQKIETENIDNILNDTDIISLLDSDEVNDLLEFTSISYLLEDSEICELLCEMYESDSDSEEIQIQEIKQEQEDACVSRGDQLNHQPEVFDRTQSVTCEMSREEYIKDYEERQKLERAFKRKFGGGEQKYSKIDGVVGYHKKFDEGLLIKYDFPARDKIKKILGDFVSENPNKYEQDLLINSPTCKYKYLELQVCSNWVNEKFPHPNVYIYARKAKYGRDTLFLTLNRFLTRGYIFDGQSHEGVKPKRFKKYSRQFIYEIPWNRVMPVVLEFLDKEAIEMY